ncbi:MAG: PA0069 family radical SAM protein [Isosphaeraceae bacterium]|nr:PA0069 family radical SAM protein [Isosphaeraceae bacterium]
MDHGPKRPTRRGRGAGVDPPNRFERTHTELDLDATADDVEYLESLANPATEYLPDRSRSVVSENDSPDVGFRFSINPYRGCVHGCSYCYARPSHEYLGYSAGLDFETKILVKHEAPELFREFLARPSWVPELIALSGVTDPYQPAERHFELTRGCLLVALECRQPISLITKNALIRRDLELLREMASLDLIHVNISLTTLDAALSRDMEPRASLPSSRLKAMAELSAAGIPVRVMTAPIVPGLNDQEIPALLRAARDAGARQAGMTILRLPSTVEPVFVDWLERMRPDRAEKVLGRLRRIHSGRLNTNRFGKRMTGTGELSEQIVGMFKLFRSREGLDGPLPPYDFSRFRAPLPTRGQLRLF